MGFTYLIVPLTAIVYTFVGLTLSGRFWLGMGWWDSILMGFAGWVFLALFTAVYALGVYVVDKARKQEA